MRRSIEHVLRLACVLVVLPCCAQRAEEHVRKANVLFSNHDLAGAEKEYRAALEKSDHHAGALEGLGDIEYERADWDQAIGWYQKAAEAEPRALGPLHRWAIALSTKGDTKGAIDVLSRAIEIDPKDVFALHASGGLYQKLGDLRRAEQMQVAVLQIDKEHRAARFALANLFLDQGRFEEAEKELTRLDMLGGEAKPLAEYGFARVAGLRGRWDEAARHLLRVLESGVAHPDKILADVAFARGWSEPPMKEVRAKLGTQTSTGAHG
jgi:tetratricopeptide (TPR) repeat protein